MPGPLGFFVHVLLAVSLGAALAACGLPQPWSAASALPLAGALLHAALAPRPRQVAGRLFWVGVGFFTVHLWWLTDFLAELLGVGALAGLLFVLEGGFFAAMAFLTASMARTPAARLWALAGGWVVLEWLRFLGPLAFPWPTMGSTLLGTPAVQIADLGGVLLGSVLTTGTAAALGQTALALAGRTDRRGWRRARPLALAALAWVLALGYGWSRTPGLGPEQPMLVFRTPFNSHARATQAVSPEQQREQLLQASERRRVPGEVAREVVVWPETAMSLDADPASALGRPNTLGDFPAPGLTGVGGPTPGVDGGRYNAAAAVDGAGNVTGWNDKAKLVPFGEHFPFPQLLGPLYSRIEQSLGFIFPVMQPNAQPTPLRLTGVLCGTYICYDSVFSWVSRELAAQGAQVLVNVSNDGWYQGWGVQQHFQMGRLRAIETRRWVVRSVNRGVAAAIDDLGRPVAVLDEGDTVRPLHVRPRLLSGQTLYVRFGDLPALLLAALMMLNALRLDWRYRRVFPG